MARTALLALAAVLSASAVLGCERLVSEYMVENGVVSVMVENSCALNGFDFEVKCCSSSGCEPASVSRDDVALGPTVNAFATSNMDYIHVINNRVTGGSRIKDTQKVPLFLPESCRTMTEGDSSLPLCSSVSENFQVLVTVETQCSSGTVKINGMLFPDEALDLATSRVAMVQM